MQGEKIKQAEERLKNVMRKKLGRELGNDELKELLCVVFGIEACILLIVQNTGQDVGVRLKRKWRKGGDMQVRVRTRVRRNGCKDRSRKW